MYFMSIENEAFVVTELLLVECHIILSDYAHLRCDEIFLCLLWDRFKLIAQFLCLRGLRNNCLLLRPKSAYIDSLRQHF